MEYITNQTKINLTVLCPNVLDHYSFSPFLIFAQGLVDACLVLCGWHHGDKCSVQKLHTSTCWPLMRSYTRGFWSNFLGWACTSLQKQVGYFNHRVVTLVADKLERQWLWVLKTNYIWQHKRQLPSSSYNHNTLNICEGTICSLLQLWSAIAITPSQMFWGLSVCLCTFKLLWLNAITLKEKNKAHIV